MEKKLKDKLKKLYNKRIVIDSSVLIKTFKEEEGSSFVDKILGMVKKNEATLLAPTLIEYEFLNVITRGIHDSSEISKILRRFKSINIGILPLEESAISKATKYCREDPQISFYDAAYHAMAKDMDAIFLTADEKYYKSAKKRGNIQLLSQI